MHSKGQASDKMEEDPTGGEQENNCIGDVEIWIQVCLVFVQEG